MTVTNESNVHIAPAAELHNGSAFSGRPGTRPRWNHKDRSARPICCSVGLSSTLAWQPSRRKHCEATATANQTQADRGRSPQCPLLACTGCRQVTGDAEIRDRHNDARNTVYHSDLRLLVLDNGSDVEWPARHRAALSNCKDRSAGPVRSSGWLSSAIRAGLGRLRTRDGLHPVFRTF